VTNGVTLKLKLNAGQFDELLSQENHGNKMNDYVTSKMGCQKIVKTKT